MVMVVLRGGNAMGGKQIKINLRYNCTSVKLDRSSVPPSPTKPNIGRLLGNLEYMYCWEHYHIV